MKRIPILITAAMMLCSCSYKSESSGAEKTQTTAAVRQTQKREAEKLTAEVISFEGDILTLSADGGELSFDTSSYYQSGGLDKLDRAIACNSFGIKVNARVTYYKDKNELIGLDLVSPNGKELTDELYVKSISENTAVLETNGRELEADISPLAYSGFAVFGEQYINGPYMAAGIIFDGDNKCVLCDLSPLTGESGGIKNYGVEEKDIIESYLCAEVESCDGGTVTLLRREDKKQLSVIAAITDDPSRLKEGGFVYYAPLDDKGYDAPGFCVLLAADDIEGDLSYVSDYQGRLTVTLQGSEKIETGLILDEQGSELEADAVKSGRVKVTAENIISRGRLSGGEYKATVVTVK